MKGLKRLVKYQRAVHWPLLSRSQDGTPTYGRAEEIGCRWIEWVGTLTTASGGTLIVQAKVYVDRDVSIDDALKQGTLDTVTNFSDPYANGLVYRVQDWRKTQGPHGKGFLRLALL